MTPSSELSPHKALCIGIDLDNTIICYDHAFVAAAREQGLLPSGFSGTKQQVRDHIRVLPGQDGENLWQKLQGYVYGAGIAHAKLFDGVVPFLERAKANGDQLYIVSHKTEFGHFDPKRINLRHAATAFLKQQKIFNYISQENLFFCATRSEKIDKILSLKCDLFVDDLEEIFDDPAFPTGVRKLLFAAAPPYKASEFEQCNDWLQVEQRIFDVRTYRPVSE